MREVFSRIQKRVDEIEAHTARYPSWRETTTCQHAEDLKAVLASWPIATDGPHEITKHRLWLARQLMDSRQSDAEAFGIVACHDKIRSACTA